LNTTAEIASGQQNAWLLNNKIGEGDSGEVFLVESLLDHRTAILKRPSSHGFPSDIIRQASQIEKEGQILGALSCLDIPGILLHAPSLLDQSKSGNQYSERFFIVIDQAKGFDLVLLARTIHFSDHRYGSQQVSPLDNSFTTFSNHTTFDEYYLNLLSTGGKIPNLILLRAMIGLIEFLEEIHKLEITVNSSKYYGVIWNDIKPEHIFWNPTEANFTVVDWGNSQFLEVDGATKDRTYSRFSDHYQLILEMGRFLKEYASDLYPHLGWPDSITPLNSYSSGILPLKEKLTNLLSIEMESLKKVRQEEAQALQVTKPSFEGYTQLANIHQQILGFGEIPDYENARKLFLLLASDLISIGEPENFRRLCLQAIRYPILNNETFQLLGKITEIIIQNNLPIQVLQSGLNEDWPLCLWELCLAAQNSVDSTWWNELCNHIRTHQLGPGVISPLVALNRVIHSLESDLQNNVKGKEDHSKGKEENHTSAQNTLLESLKEEIIPRWMSIEPDPPDSGLDYSEIESHLDQIVMLVPQAGDTLTKSLDQPQSQIKITMDAWERRDFSTARRCLRQVLLWDPDRLRVITADRAIQTAVVWLNEVREGLITDEPLQEFITRHELTGRELRNQVGPATWLDSLLEAFKQLRRGSEPTDVLTEHTDIRTDLNWIIALEPRRPLVISPDKPVLLERNPQSKIQQPKLFGIKESSLFSKSGISLFDPLDTWVPEARGSSARLFSGCLNGPSNETQLAAIKLMRQNRIDYALPLFREETRILSLLRDVPGVVPLLECGFIHLDKGQQIPSEESSSSISELSGVVTRFGLDSVHNFLADIGTKVDEGWLPYLAIEKLEKSDNLLLHCDTGHTHGRFLPTLEGLRMGIQICDILETAHARNITYRDHKILHYYWQDDYNGIFMIDWNIAKRFPEGVSEEEIRFDLVQFGARALHYIMTGRQAPGALPMGPNRPEEIEAAAQSYSTRWGYDDQRLPKDIKDMLEALLNGYYQDAKSLREDMHSIFTTLSQLF